MYRYLRFYVAFVSLLFCFQAAISQERDEDKHGFHVFVKDSNGTRIDLPENEHHSTKLTGFFTQRAKIVFWGKEAKTKLTGKEDLYFEIVDTAMLQPQFFRLMHLREKKGNREMTCWTSSMVIGSKDSSKDFIPTLIYPIDDRIYRISIKDLKPGHYVLTYQVGYEVLAEHYDFDM